jgi:hypothetical protein
MAIGKERTYRKDFHGHVDGLLTPAEMTATVKMVQTLAADLDYDKPNFGQTVDGLLLHARSLRKNERKLRSHSGAKPDLLAAAKALDAVLSRWNVAVMPARKAIPFNQALAALRVAIADEEGR